MQIYAILWRCWSAPLSAINRAAEKTAALFAQLRSKQTRGEKRADFAQTKGLQTLGHLPESEYHPPQHPQHCIIHNRAASKGFMVTLSAVWRRIVKCNFFVIWQHCERDVVQIAQGLSGPSTET